jgi:hypothetical protein
MKRFKIGGEGSEIIRIENAVGSGVPEAVCLGTRDGINRESGVSGYALVT